jgi:hypothetical protein
MKAHEILPELLACASMLQKNPLPERPTALQSREIENLAKHVEVVWEILEWLSWPALPEEEVPVDSDGPWLGNAEESNGAKFLRWRDGEPRRGQKGGE